MGKLEQWLAFSLLFKIHLEGGNWKHSCLLSAVLAVLFSIARNIDKQREEEGRWFIFLEILMCFKTSGNLKHVNLETPKTRTLK